MVERVVVTSAARTAIGAFGGTLKDVSAIDLGTIAARAAIERSGLDGEAIGHSVIGNVIHGEARDMYISRVISVNAGVSRFAPALTVNRLCGSGLQAIVSAAQTLMLGDCDAVLAGGAESMSNGGYLMPRLRFGARMGETAVVDMMQGALYDPFGHGLMGITAENIAERYGIDREAQDAFALESQRRAAAAIEAGHFKDQIVPVPVTQRRETFDFLVDEHPRAVTSDKLAGMRPVFKKDGSVTAGNASGINDGAAALTMVAESAAGRLGVTPIARIMAYGHAAVEPDEMGVGPVPAVRIALERDADRRYGTNTHLVRFHSGVAVSHDPRDRGHAKASGGTLGNHGQGGRAIIDPRGIARRHAAVLLEHRAHASELVRRDRARVLIDEKIEGFAPLGHRHRHDLILKVPGFDRSRSAALAFQREGVLGFAVDAVALGDVFRRYAHQPMTEGVVERTLHHIDHGRLTHARAKAKARHEVAAVRHTLGTAGEHSVTISEHQGLGCGDDRLQAGATKAVDR